MPYIIEIMTSFHYTPLLLSESVLGHLCLKLNLNSKDNTVTTYCNMPKWHISTLEIKSYKTIICYTFIKTKLLYFFNAIILEYRS